MASRRAPYAAASLGEVGLDRPEAHRSARDPIERRAGTAVPAPAEAAAPATGPRMRCQRLDGALLAPADDLRSRARAPRRPRSDRVLDAAHAHPRTDAPTP